MSDDEDRPKSARRLSGRRGAVLARLGGGARLDEMVAVGRTTSTSTRIWVRTPSAGAHRLSIRRAVGGAEVGAVEFHVPGTMGRDLTHAVSYPDDFAGAAPLAPLTLYRFEVTRSADGSAIGKGRFETAPAGPADTPATFAIAALSCHQPFNSDGAVSERHLRTLGVLERVFNQTDTRFALLTGDQMYSDVPECCSVRNDHYVELAHGKPSILDFTAPQIRAIYQDRYRAFWQMKELKSLYAGRPTYPMLDDHEILDDWGAEPEHRGEDHLALLEGAREAYFDYQGSRVSSRAPELPASFHYDFEWGYVGAFVMDIRSERYVGKERVNQIYSAAQLADLRAFLARSAAKRLLLIVSSVPIVHIPEGLTNVGGRYVGDIVDFRDHWSLRENVAARDQLLALLIEHQRANPNQRIVLVGGDVHLSCAMELAFKGVPPIYQFTSSAISNRLGPAQGFLGSQGPKSVSSLEVQTGAGPLGARISLVRRWKGSIPFSGPNVGILRVRLSGQQVQLRFELWSHLGSGGSLQPTSTFLSEWYP